MVHPAVVCLCEMQRRLIVRDRHERLDVVFPALVEEIVVELQPRLIRLRIVTVRIDTAPRNRRAKHLEPHLGEEGDILLVSMIEVDRRKFQIVRRRLCSRCARDAARHDILYVDPLAVQIVCALALICRDRTAPEEALRKCHIVLLCRSMAARAVYCFTPVRCRCPVRACG